MTVFRFAIRRSFGNVTNVVFLLILPLVCVFFPHGEEWPYLPYGYQYFGIVLLFAGIRLTSILLEDRAKGVVKRLAVAPIRYSQYLAQHLLGYSVLLVLQCLILIAGGVLVGHELYRPLWLLILYISFSFTAIAIALAWISFFRSKDTAFLVYMSIIFMFVLLGGLMIPLHLFPEPLARIAVLFPTYWLAEGQHQVVFGSGVLDFMQVNAVLWLYTVIFLIVGSTKKIH